MDAAIAMYASLQSQLDVSKKELKDVEKLLAEAEQRAVNNDNDNLKLEGGSNKRRKVSPPPQDDDTDTNNNNSAGVAVKMEDNDHAYDEETDKEDEDETTNQAKVNNSNTNVEPANSNTAYTQSNDVNNRTTANTNKNKEGVLVSTTAAVSQSSTHSNTVNQVIVENCGNSYSSGTYIKIVGQTYEGALVYSNGDYVIYRDIRSMGNNNWYVGYWNGKYSRIGKYSPYYGSPNNAESMSPPTNGWVTLRGGFSPAPKLRLVTIMMLIRKMHMLWISQ